MLSYVAVDPAEAKYPLMFATNVLVGVVNNTANNKIMPKFAKTKSTIWTLAVFFTPLNNKMRT
jgi:hypothetical protein